MITQLWTVLDHILFAFCFTEDAKRMAIKEEQYDPGYEAAFGGVYGEPAPEGVQSNGYCNFSSSEKTGWYHLSSVKHKKGILKYVPVFFCCPCNESQRSLDPIDKFKIIFIFKSLADTAEEAPTNPNAVGQVQDGQWMMQSFADQIPDIGSSSQAQSWGV